MSTPAAPRPDLVVLPRSDSPGEGVVEMRRIRKHQLLNLIRENSNTSRAELSRLSGYNLPNVSSLVDELVREGLVHESTAVKTPRGRRPVPVSLNDDAAMVLGIDLGRRSTIGLLMNLRGKILHRVEKSTPKADSVQAQVRWVGKFAEEMLEKRAGLPPLVGAGVAMPGLAQARPDFAREGSVLQSVRDALTERLGVPVLVDNDSRMMALGSLWFGSGQKFSTFAILNMTHGIGLGIVINRRICQGAFGNAGEIGHIPIGEPGIPCYCGGSGCLENTASGSGIMRLAEKYRLTDAADASAVGELARQGDKQAIRVFEDFSEALARGIGIVANVLNPQAVILAGYVSHASDVFLPRLTQRVAEFTLPAMQNPPTIVIEDLHENAGPLGAGAAVLHHIFFVSHLQLEELL